MGMLDTTAPPEVVEAELEGARRRLGDLLAELVRRRHHVRAVGRRLRRAVLPAALAAGAIALVVAGLGAAIRGRGPRRRRRGVLRALARAVTPR